MRHPSAEVGRLCRICGSERTVRSHLFPRALIRKLRGTSKHVVEGDRLKSRVRFSQSGLWDDGILCGRHEAHLGAADDYAIRLSRKIDKTPSDSALRTTIEFDNNRPDLLQIFAGSVIWRHAVSHHGRQHGLDRDLGPYLALLENWIFHGQNCPIEVLVAQSHLIDSRGKYFELAIAPYRNRLDGRWIWQFTIANLDFYVKTDKRPFDLSWMPYLASADPLILTAGDPISFHQIPKFRGILSKMIA